MDFGRGGILKSHTAVLFRRDFWLFFREPSQWLHLMLMFLLLMIFLVSVGSLELRLTQPFLQVVSYLVVFLFNGFLLASVSLRFVFPAVSLEGRSFWCVRSSPVSVTKLYWFKFLLSFLFVLLVGEVLAVVSSTLMRNDPLLLKVSTFSTAFIALALTSVNLGAGGYFAAFEEKNPIRVASSQGASLTFLLSMIYLASIVAALVIPLNRYFDLLIIHGMPTTNWVYPPLGIIGALSLFLFIVSTRIGLHTIGKDL
jgi:ABC-2 type transport system permease protein